LEGEVRRAVPLVVDLQLVAAARLGAERDLDADLGVLEHRDAGRRRDERPAGVVLVVLGGREGRPNRRARGWDAVDGAELSTPTEPPSALGTTPRHHGDAITSHSPEVSSSFDGVPSECDQSADQRPGSSGSWPDLDQQPGAVAAAVTRTAAPLAPVSGSDSVGSSMRSCTCYAVRPSIAAISSRVRPACSRLMMRRARPASCRDRPGRPARRAGTRGFPSVQDSPS
jgi:hypothetical protein